MVFSQPNFIDCAGHRNHLKNSLPDVKKLVEVLLVGPPRFAEGVDGVIILWVFCAAVVYYKIDLES